MASIAPAAAKCTDGRVLSTVMGMRLVTLAVIAGLCCGCFGYNRPAKRWAYLGNTVLILGGGAAIASDQLGSSDDGMAVSTAAPEYEPPVSGVLLVGAMLVSAGLFGILFNATRPIVKTSR
jgi:hypothetical protein